MPTEFKLPHLGEGVESGDVVSVLVSEGDTIEAEQGVVELETDKALVEVPSGVSGTVVSVHVKAGDIIPPGTVLLTVEETVASVPESAISESPEIEDPEPSPPEPETPVVEEPPPQLTEPEPEPVVTPKPAAAPPEPTPARPPKRSQDGTVPAAPSTRRFARELGVDLSQIPGSGAGGRIVQEDVKAYVQNVIASGGGPVASAPLPDFTQWGEIERKPLTRIRRVIADNLSSSWNLIPHVTQFDSADVTDLEAFRQRNKAAAEDRGAKLTPTVLVLKAVISALKAFPQVNASLDAAAGELILKQYYNLGIAVDTERGLMVPVIKDVDRKDLFELAFELSDLGERTRTNKVTPDELQGGTFTVTNLGSLGVGPFTPIVNHPEVAILGIGRSKEEAVVVDQRVEPRLMMPVCLSYDHRVIDGADGARFLRSIIQSLENPEQMLLGG